MTFFLKRKISFFLSGIAQTFLFLPILLNRSVIHVVFLTVVLGHRMPWDSVIRCNNTGTTHSALSSRTELLLPIGGVINNWKRRAWNGFPIQWIWRYSFIY
ncbi:BEM_HP_G0057220.mRNA.1.CDS.1 [Saccharomyces cerevisiae]|nr:BEM_HP_G0011470.mRNA.1.CDS.1 [Saccharomyces cerevisiae]CAI5083385.1 BEM_HP_G0057220.mRNA.1.CDS.1 [Saccharomyces cerevisiae]CAI6899892.1 BEM_HP_G0011470.mRNA.1.CDS.1 [Saccharomyces cerevisiae]CAI6968637.1 BEM_HP_G0057220.mRNA.1.CDS.1 [Saccharomyces cerevisiae]